MAIFNVILCYCVGFSLVNLQNMHIVNLVASDNLPSEKVKPIYGTTILPLPASQIL